MGDFSGGWQLPPNSGIMNEYASPSDTARMARQKSEDIMQALKSGEPGAADKMLGKSEQKGTDGIVPLGFFKGKFGRSKKDKANDKVKESPSSKEQSSIGGNEDKSGVNDYSGKQESEVFVSTKRFGRSMKDKDNDKVVR